MRKEILSEEKRDLRKTGTFQALPAHKLVSVSLLVAKTENLYFSIRLRCIIAIGIITRGVVGQNTAGRRHNAVQPVETQNIKYRALRETKILGLP